MRVLTLQERCSMIHDALQTQPDFPGSDELDSLLDIVADLADHVKTLVAAVDSIRDGQTWRDER